MSLRDAPTINSIAVFVYAAILAVCFSVAVLLPLWLGRAFLFYLLAKTRYDHLEFVDAAIIFAPSLFYAIVIAVAGVAYVVRLEKVSQHPFKPGDGDFVEYSELFVYQMKHHAAAFFMGSSVTFIAYVMYYLAINQNPTPAFTGDRAGNLSLDLTCLFVGAWLAYWIGRRLYWEWLLLGMPDRPRGVLRGRTILRAYEVETMIDDEDDEDDVDSGTHVIT